ncbi:hypothetical protein CRYUN_Cryun10bG0006600 [Craigia yunnanensis]
MLDLADQKDSLFTLVHKQSSTEDKCHLSILVPIHHLSKERVSFCSARTWRGRS